MANSIRISGIFNGLQSGGPYAGMPAAIVLLAGCRINCVTPGPQAGENDGREMTVDEALVHVRESGLRRTLVAGGEPLLQEGCLELTNRLLETGLNVALESHATVDLSEVDRRVNKLIDLICPSNGTCNPIRWSNLELFTTRDSIRFLIADRGDYVWARDVIKRERLLGRLAVQLSPLYGALKPKVLAEWIITDRLSVQLQIPLDQILAGLPPV